MRPALLVAAGLVAMAYAEVQPHPVRPIRFAAGRSRVTVGQSVERGAADTWRFDARAGQRADIRITSVEHNAAFTVYAPPATATPGDGGSMDIHGTVLKRGGKSRLDDGAQTSWTGRLPKSGGYYVQVAPDRGGATYRLTVRIS